MNQAERNYTISNQECLAVIWAVKYFHHYLGLQPFTIVTDHAALKWLQTSYIPKGRRARWLMNLQRYNFEININLEKATKMRMHYQDYRI